MRHPRTCVKASPTAAPRRSFNACVAFLHALMSSSSHSFKVDSSIKPMPIIEVKKTAK